jgi:monolysocardiolipin acyltransferase
LSRFVKVLPIKRGIGIDQAALTLGVQKLNQGDWIQYFPEGTRTRSGELGSTRMGIGKLVALPEVTPIVVPIVHSGLENVMPLGTYVPIPGKKVTTTFYSLLTQQRFPSL